MITSFKTTLILTIALLCLSTAHAAEWEYKVVFLPGTINNPQIKLEKSGAYIDQNKTEILNKLGNSGWELIAVTGESGADHALYMRKLRE